MPPHVTMQTCTGMLFLLHSRNSKQLTWRCVSLRLNLNRPERSCSMHVGIANALAAMHGVAVSFFFGIPDPGILKGTPRVGYACVYCQWGRKAMHVCT